MTRIFTAFLLVFQVSAVSAHDGRPVYLEVNQISDTEYELAWRIPFTVQPYNLPAIYLEGSCNEKKTLSATKGLRGKRLYECVGQDVSLQISLHFPQTNELPRDDVWCANIFVLHSLEGNTFSHTLHP